MPLVWLARAKGFRWVSRVYGPDFMLEFCRLSQQAGLRHYLYGSSDHVLDLLKKELLKAFPSLLICGSYSPRMRSIGEADHLDDVERIRAADPDIVFQPRAYTVTAARQHPVHDVFLVHADASHCDSRQ